MENTTPTPNQTNPSNWIRSKFTSRLVYRWSLEKWNTIAQRTINGPYSRSKSVTSNPQQRSYLAKGITLDMTKDEFFNFCSNNEELIFEMLTDNKRPSIDRIDNTLGYSTNNIQIIPLIDNILKDRQSDTHTKLSKVMMMLKNRKQYLEGQHYDIERPLVIDYYLKMLKNYKHYIRLLSKLINTEMILNPFDKANEYTIYDEKAITVCQTELNKIEEDKIEKQNKLNAKLESIQNKKLEYEEKIKNKQITLDPRYDYVYNYLKNRKKIMLNAIKNKTNLRISTNIDDRVLKEKTKTLAIDIIKNSFEIIESNIKKEREHNHKPPTHKNISWDNSGCKYIAQYTYCKKTYHVGRFDTEDEAVKALAAHKDATRLI